MSTKFARALSAFAGDKHGNVAMLFGLMAVALFLCMGLAIDMGRWLQAKQATIAAMDAAVLAGGRALQINPNDDSAAIAIAQKYYVENTKERLPVLTDTVSFQITNGGQSITAQGNAYIKTTIMGLGGINELPLLTLTGAEYSSAKLATGSNAEMNIEISMMLDITGSMAGTKLSDLKAAAKDLIDIVVLDDQSKYTSKVALVPFSQAVNLGSTYFNAITNKNTNSNIADLEFEPAATSATSSVTQVLRSLSFIQPAYAKKKKTGDSDDHSSQTYGPCAVDRTGANAMTDAAPAAGSYLQAYDIARQSVSHTKDQPCKPSAVTIQPLSSNKTALKAKINSFIADGWTAGAVGTAYAWYMLSPEWANIWPADSTPASYSDPKTKKYAILMTDGEYNTWYNGNSNGTASAQAVALCNNMKAKGIAVYTIGFQLDSNQTAINTLASCATDADHVYIADNGNQLKESFRDIALKLSNLYLSK